jgi:hypothetical protein
MNCSTNSKKFSGWGISLCWWANIEYPESVLEKLIHLLFDKSGLALNIVRYNLGGGSDPNRKQNFRLGANMPCIIDETDNFHLKNDSLQLNVLSKAVEAGVDTVEIFCNSPPYFMTKSRYTNGSNKSWDCNLRSDCINRFVDFLNRSYKLLGKSFPIVSINPFNEPSNPFWTTQVDQEGCFYDYNTRREIVKRLNVKNQSIKIASADESHSLFALLWYLISPKSLIDRINVHGYNYVDWRGIHFNFFDYTIWRRLLRVFYKGELWVSEYGLGCDNTITDSLKLARQIFRDLDTLSPDAWVYWQVEHITSSWGLLKIDFENPTCIYIQAQYWVFKHFTNTLRPGDTYKILSSSILQIDNIKQRKYVILNDTADILDLDLNNTVDIIDSHLHLHLKSCYYSDNDNEWASLTSAPIKLQQNSIISVIYNK